MVTMYKVEQYDGGIKTAMYGKKGWLFTSREKAVKFIKQSVLADEFIGTGIDREYKLYRIDFNGKKYSKKCLTNY